jgi:hypothetical protein
VNQHTTRPHKDVPYQNPGLLDGDEQLGLLTDLVDQLTDFITISRDSAVSQLELLVTSLDKALRADLDEAVDDI